ncbi:hypothetical protein KC19_1G322500 [Ceratodon purpureus]|uniref:Uncharacterized protein n=1 Tax=Ceratodon purpureus TaxID=3225 RepID=A0A8T0JEP7_CERPU|nr:hypothetical protein KC19_1G322500 [Ceratodon purpureus]
MWRVMPGEPLTVRAHSLWEDPMAQPSLNFEGLILYKITIYKINNFEKSFEGVLVGRFLSKGILWVLRAVSPYLYMLEGLTLTCSHAESLMGRNLISYLV